MIERFFACLLKINIGYIWFIRQGLPCLHSVALPGLELPYSSRGCTCLVPALIDDSRCGRCIITKSQSPKFTGGLGAAWLDRVN
ncbi:hypothetical protein PoB_007405100 [Plakobranchus ocellatus]|uniref:Secreted protein n=1 Tax=Plakobranchus ocellatus TaxID=259542 RepID=A0AAV4DUG6_9GAST|nr:hypothetical protein PoB_007405100 [Plakobranchus ocellatus]